MDFALNIVLEDERVRLRPYQETDLPELEAIALEEEIWRHTVTRISNKQELAAWGQAALTDRAASKRYTFVIVDKATNRVTGSTAYGNISAADQRLEIGWTWLAKEHRGSGLNRHCKFLLLSYAFEVLHYERVELKTDVLNLRSRRAMQKIGAREEGVLRSHTRMHDGRRRDTIYYSILRPEWPQIRQTIFTDFRPLTPA